MSGIDSRHIFSYTKVMQIKHKIKLAANKFRLQSIFSRPVRSQRHDIVRQTHPALFISNPKAFLKSFLLHGTMILSPPVKMNQSHSSCLHCL